MRVAVNDVAVRLGLADIRMAIRNPFDTAFLCFRAIEGVKNRFESWDTFRDALTVSQPELMDLKSLADPRRHGSERHLSHDQRVAALQLAHRVIGRYLDYVEAHSTEDGTGDVRASVEPDNS